MCDNSPAVVTRLPKPIGLVHVVVSVTVTLRVQKKTPQAFLSVGVTVTNSGLQGPIVYVQLAVYVFPCS